VKNVLKSGFGLLEIIIGVAITATFIFTAMEVSRFSLRLSEATIRKAKTAFLLEEGIEAVKFLRDSGWDANIGSLTGGTNYYLNFDGSKWQATTTNIFIDEVFERKFILNDVNRNADDDISDFGNPDPDTKKISVSVSSQGRTGTSTEQISAYITNLFNN